MPRSPARDELLAHELREAQQERAFFGVLFRENVVLVVEDVEGLRQLEGVARDECGFLRRDRRVQSRIERSRQQDNLP